MRRRTKNFIAVTLVVLAGAILTIFLIQHGRQTYDLGFDFARGANLRYELAARGNISSTLVVFGSKPLEESAEFEYSGGLSLEVASGKLILTSDAESLTVGNEVVNAQRLFHHQVGRSGVTQRVGPEGLLDDRFVEFFARTILLVSRAPRRPGERWTEKIHLAGDENSPGIRATVRKQFSRLEKGEDEPLALINLEVNGNFVEERSGREVAGTIKVSGWVRFDLRRRVLKSSQFEVRAEYEQAPTGFEGSTTEHRRFAADVEMRAPTQ